VAYQILAIFETDTGSTKSPAKRMLQIVHADRRQPCPQARPAPAAVQYSVEWPTVLREHLRLMNAVDELRRKPGAIFVGLRSGASR
jgi:hypothetical protein